MASIDAAKDFTSSVRTTLGKPFTDMPWDYTLAHLIQHGGLQLLHSPTKMQARILRHSPQPNPETANTIALGFQQTAQLFFQRLSNKHYAIPSELVSWLTFPYDGETFTKGPERPNYKIPSVFTFVGQFIDHDLTFNGLDLFDDQLATPPPDFASPKLDLDSVYGRIYPPGFYKPGTQATNSADVFAADGTFRLERTSANKYDLRRASDPQSPFRVDSAYIFDPRNDENQLLLQVHILIERLHNRLVVNETGTRDEKIAKTRAKVVEIWQSVVLNDFLPRVCMLDVVAERRQAIKNAVATHNYSALHYKPDADGRLQMPHEFAIGFRFGHSMLRDAYQVNADRFVNLFINRDVDNQGDLRGGKKLASTGNFIDWDIFYTYNSSLLIDTQVTPAVFDLPESTIPDEDKTVGNLPFRNLTRSRTINVACGEDLAAVFGLSGTDVLNPEQVEPDLSASKFYQDDRNVYPDRGGKGEPVAREPYHGYKDQRFKTPLWYYILREAEWQQGGLSLGKLGSLLVSEVILGGIYYGTTFAYKDAPDSVVLGTKKQSEVMFLDIVSFVKE